jgi:DNA relaxase NicK
MFINVMGFSKKNWSHKHLERKESFYEKNWFFSVHPNADDYGRISTGGSQSKLCFHHTLCGIL